jgi:putative endopeptidase
MAPDLRTLPVARVAPFALAMLMAFGTTAAVAAKKKPVKPAVPSACSDFYQNVNQPLLAAHPLPTGLASYSRWNELNISAQQQLQGLLTGKGPAPTGAVSRLLSDLVASSSDAAAMDAGVRATVAPLLKQIDGARKPRELARVIIALHAAGVPVLYGFDALRDEASGRPLATFYPSGLGLPDAAYYAEGTPELKPGVDAYRGYLAEQLRFAGVADAKAVEQATQAWGMEQTLARAMATAGREQLSPAALAKSYSNLQLADLMQTVGWSPSVVSVSQPLYFHAVDKLLAKPNVAQWQAYLRTQVMHSLAPARGADPRLGYLAALKITSGQPLQPVDRLSLLALAEGADLASAAYAESFPPAATAQRANAVAEAVHAAMLRAIDRAAWLDEAGKSDARTKLAALRLAIGQPPESVSVSGLVFDRGNLAANLLALRRWNLGRSLARLNSTVWPAPVQQWQPVIGYQPTQNRIVVSAAALQAPVIGTGTNAADYGSFGALVGQQLSLAFAPLLERNPAWASRQSALVTQYSAYAAGPTSRVNGAGTAPQNAADLAGLELAWDALAAQGKPDATAAKEFFRAWATVWARQDDSLALATAQATATQAPARWRVNGPLANLPAFGQAYACKPGQAMARSAKDAVAVWR